MLSGGGGGARARSDPGGGGSHLDGAGLGPDPSLKPAGLPQSGPTAPNRASALKRLTSHILLPSSCLSGWQIISSPESLVRESLLDYKHNICTWLHTLDLFAEPLRQS